MTYEMNEILFWNDIRSYLDFEKELDSKLDPNNIVEDRRKWANDKKPRTLGEVAASPTERDNRRFATLSPAIAGALPK